MRINEETMSVPAQFNSERNAPWNVLGTETVGKLNAADAIQAAGLDWNVELAPLRASYNGEFLNVPRKHAVVRDSDSKVLGVVGDRYEVLQNAEMFSFLDGIVDANDAHYEVAGHAKGGSVVWMMLKPNANEIEINGDPCEAYLLAATSHDGTSSVIVKPIIERLWCANALGWALKGTANTFRARHTASLGGKIDEARTALDLTLTYQKEFEAYAKALADIELTLSQERELIGKLVLPGKTESQEKRRETQRSEILDAVHGPTIQAENRFNAWGFVQGVNDYELWSQGRDKGRSEKQLMHALRPSHGLTERARQMIGA